MDCPKCGAQQSDDREDCSACGVVFERWRAAQERALLQSRSTASEPLPETGAHMPGWMVFAGIAVVVLLGISWTLMTRAARVRRDAKAAETANEINKQVIGRINAARAVAVAASAHAATEIEPPPSAATASAAPVGGWPDGLSDVRARATLEGCSAFSAPPDSGRRSVASFSNVVVQGDYAKADFTWIGEAGQREGAGAVSPGRVTFMRAGGRWILQSATVGSGETAMTMCN